MERLFHMFEDIHDFKLQVVLELGGDDDDGDGDDGPVEPEGPGPNGPDSGGIGGWR